MGEKSLCGLPTEELASAGSIPDAGHKGRTESMVEATDETTVPCHVCEHRATGEYAGANNDISTLREKNGDQYRHLLHRRGRVGIVEEHRISSRFLHSCAHRGTLPAVLREKEHTEGEAISPRLGTSHRTIGAPVIDDDDLV